MKRICINGRFLTQRITGIQRYAREVLLEVDALVAAGDVPAELDWTLAAPKGTRFPALRRIRCMHVGRLGGHAWEQLELPGAAAGALLVSFGSTGPLAVRRQVITIHDASVYRVPEAFSWRFRVWYRLLLGRLVRRAPRTMVVSPFSASEAERYFGATRERLDVTSEGWEHLQRARSDDSILERHGLSPRSYVLAVSSPTPNKNFGIVVEAMRQMRNVSLRFVVTGSVDPRVLVPVLGLDGENLIRTGYVSDEELKSLYENALCFVFPSRYEGFGIPPLEAMALGCPVVASSIDATRDVCGDAACYFDPDDASALGAILTRIASDGGASERHRMAERGRVRAANFSWKTGAKRVIQSIARASACP